MALGVNINSNGNKKFLKLKIKGGARFSIQGKNPSTDKYEETGNTKIVNGALKKIEHKTFEWDGKTNNIISIELVDNDESYVIDFGNESSIGRSIIASLINIKEYGHIMQLSLYKKKYKDSNGETKTSDSVGLTYNGELLKWFYNIADKTDKSGLPAVKEVMLKGEKVLDSYERDTLLLDDLINLIERLPAPEKLDNMPNVTSIVDEVEVDEELDKAFGGDEDEDDIPTKPKAKPKKVEEQELNIEDIPFN